MEPYICEKCNEEWEFFPEDYDFEERYYPDICPLCGMSISDMFITIYEEEGLLEALKSIFKRIFSFKK